MDKKSMLLKIIENKAQGEIIKNDGNLKLKLNFEYLIYWQEDKENEIPEIWSAVGWKVGPYSRNFVEFLTEDVATISGNNEWFVICLK